MSTTPATEIVTLPIPQSSTIEDPSSEAGKKWAGVLATVNAQPGFQRCFYGRQVENPDVLNFLLDWDSVEAHKQFVGCEAWLAMKQNIGTIADSSSAVKPSVYHVNFAPHPPPAFRAPVTEYFATFHHPAISADERCSFETAIAAITRAVDGAKGSKGVAGGWVLEELDYERLPGGKAKPYVAVYGWESVEAHMAFRETDAFAATIGPIRSALKGNMSMHHIKLTGA
ncbi:MAG: hypothetical protein M1825_001779 [Sarcosagium campestre]|nr:MAG: hypothetical protein M1825_001779 [Sarcosagium campestre]